MSDDLLPYFLAEGRENIDRAAEALDEIERSEDAGDAVERVFRALHTLKGSAALFDMAELTGLLHAAESGWETAREGGPLAPATAAALRACLAETGLWLDALAAAGEVPPERRAAAAALTASPAPSGMPASARPMQTRTLRVEASELDAAAGLVDQLSLAAGRLAQETAKALGDLAGAPGVADALLAQEQALAALRAAMARLRLAPLRPLFAALPRQVREMAEAVGKSVELTTSGEGVALDKAILDGLYEPLLHLLRNAVDHGVEPPDARAAAGKPPRGRTSLTATAKGDAAVIEVADDGAGLDLARIRSAAAARGLVSAEAAAALSDAEAADLIFRPGFSTAAAVTDLSGRGVGLDAVRAALTAMGGRVEMLSEPGRGAVARIVTPLRTLVARVAIIAVGGEEFATPLEAVIEVVRLPRAETTAIRASDAFVLRGETLPLVRLAPLLGLEAGLSDPLIVLVVSSPSGPVGVVVDSVVEIVQVPIQSASVLLACVPGVTGSLLRGDGRIVLALDLAALTA